MSEPPLSEILPVADVLEMIDPVDPDNLVHLGQGVYEARWLDESLARQEAEQLRANRLVQMRGEVFKAAPAYCVRFTIKYVPTVSSKPN